MAKTSTKPAKTDKAASAKTNTKAETKKPGAKGGKAEKANVKTDAKEDKKAAKAKGKNPLAEGDIVVFDGYSKEVEDPAFQEGDYIRVLEIKGTDKFTAERINTTEDDEEDEETGEKVPAADTCFVGEVHTPDEKEQEEIDAILEQEEGEDEEADDEDGEEDGEEEDSDEDSDEESEDDDDSEESEDEDESEDDEDAEEDGDDEDSDEDESEDEDEEDEEEEAKPKAKAKGKDKASKSDAKPAKAEKSGKPAKAEKAKPEKAKKPAKAEAEDEDEGEDEEEDKIVLPDNVQAIIEESGGDALEAVKAVKNRMEGNVVDMGLLLTHVHQNNIHHTILKEGKPVYDADKKGFTAYVKDTVGLAPRVAYGYMAVARLALEFGIGSDVVAQIGWTKLQHICDIADAKNIKGLLGKAEKLNREDLVNYVRETYTDKGEGSGKRKSSDDKTKKLTLKVSVFGDQADLVKTVLADAKKEIGKDDDGAALVHVFQQFVDIKGGNDEDESDETEDESEDEDESEEEAKPKAKAKKPAKVEKAKK